MIQIKKLMGYRGWKVWMSSDMHISLLALFYILIVDNLFRPLESLVLISSIGFYFMYGFLINDFFDAPYDIAVGKKKVVQEIPKIAFGGIILGVVFISVLHLLYLKKPLYSTIYVISYVLATLYSAPPIRFKNRGFSGIIVNGLMEKMLPVLAIFAFFNHFGIDTLIFLTTSFSNQISEIITHQIYDYESDLRTGIHTAVVRMGVDKALKIFKKFIAPFSLTLMILLISLIFIKVPYASLIGVVIFIAYMIEFALISKGKLIREEKVFPLYLACPNFLINRAFILFLAVYISLKSPLNTVLLLIAIYSQYYTLTYSFILIKNKFIKRTELFDT